MPPDMSGFDSLPKHYDPPVAESFYDIWEKAGHFSSDPVAGRDNYSILLPPPNVTGTLHMGHAFQHTLMDALVRYHRMAGKNALWQVGTDHAGIATQIVVTRLLEKRGVDAEKLSREEFLAHAWRWKEESGSTIGRQMRRLGVSCDWRRERFTMDEGLSAAVTEAFVRLHEEGLIYRGKRLVNWDPVLLTAVSDLEVISEEEDGVMYHVRYPFVDNEEEGVVIGTTRPETILVDGAIAVHPDDSRFRPLVGRKVWVPMTEPRRAIEIITDEHVDPEFGSGCVKITAAHDFNDYEVRERHPDKNIPLIILFTPDAKMNENAPVRYQGLDRYEARSQIVKDLSDAGLLVKQNPHRYKLPRGDRSGVVVEPMLTNQWFVRAKPLAEKALQLAEDGELRFVPDNWKKVYHHWLENIHDWCISRQLRWGHQIPAWYDGQGRCHVARSEAEALRQSGERTLRREEDVLDTWFSSGLWAFSTMDWPHTDNPHFKSYFPTSVLVTGFDIIFFWVARMAMMTQHFIGETPFREVYITGLVRDAQGHKMSKSRGNILDPLDLIDGIDAEALVEKRTRGLMNPKQASAIAKATRKDYPAGIAAHGVDALRFTFASLASYGRDIKFDLSRCEGYRHFCNKLWNATRFVLGVCSAEDESASAKAGTASVAVYDQWIVSRLQQTKAAVAEAFEVYRFDRVAHELYQFFWHGYCDWYVELAKVQLREGDAAVRQQTRKTLLLVLEEGLRLCHPIIPFITEQLWLKVAPLAEGPKSESIMLAPWPTTEPDKRSEEAEARWERLRKAVEGIRHLHREAAALRVQSRLLAKGEDLAGDLPHIGRLAGISEISEVESITENLPFLRVDNWHFALQYEATSEMMEAQWSAEREKVEKELAAVDAVLSNPQFVAKAKPQAVEKKKNQKHELEKKLVDLRARIANQPGGGQ